MPSDPELQQRGRLVGSLGHWREMPTRFFGGASPQVRKIQLPLRSRPKPAPQFQLSVLVQGQPKAIHIPAHRVEQVRRWVEMRQRFEQAAQAITDINLRRFLRSQEQEPGPD